MELKLREGSNPAAMGRVFPNVDGTSGVPRQELADIPDQGVDRVRSEELPAGQLSSLTSSAHQSYCENRSDFVDRGMAGHCGA